jgi:hypothetical protein
MIRTLFLTLTLPLGVGEVEDVIWAPLSSLALVYLFGSTSVAGLDFLKEILPFTDVLPVATLGSYFDI